MKIKFIYFIALASLSLASCKKSFLDVSSETSPTVDNYYTTAGEVNGATGVLYNSVWNNWFDKAFISVGDVLGGTVTGAQGNAQYNSFYNFNIQSTDGLVFDTWNSCYKAAGNASALISAFEKKKAALGDKPFLNTGIAEAKFIRAFAYFYIARTFKEAPIVADPVALTLPGGYLVPRYLQKDILRFAIEDLQFAEANLPAVSYQDGRVTKYAAKGMMAKIYLYAKDYPNAKLKAKEVIDYATANPGKLGLNPDFAGMFTSSVKANNNNIENLFSLRWLTAMSWNGGNRFQLYIGPQPLLRPLPTGGNGYSALVPSLDMLNAATGYGFANNRRQWSVMEHGYHNADWVNINFPTGFTYDTTTNNTDDFKIKTGTRSNILKYVVGPNRSVEPVNTNSHSQISTFILRYADVLLVYAEAVLAGGGSTSDATALAAYNAVHNRAGLPSVTSFTLDDLLHERKVEFAFEGDYWFDIQRQGFTKAKQMIEAQERGTYDGNKQLTSFKATITSEAQLYLPIPQSETVANPLLLAPAVPYY